MTYEEAIQYRERAHFMHPDMVDWTRLERAVEIIAERHVATQRAAHPEYDRAVRRGGQVRGSGARRRRALIVDPNDPDTRTRARRDEIPPPGWARP